MESLWLNVRGGFETLAEVRDCSKKEWRNCFCKVRGDGSIRADLGFVVPFGPSLRPNSLGQPLRNKRGRNKSGLDILPNKRIFDLENETYQANRCGCDFLISSSNSQVESPVLRSQMTLTRLTDFPLRSSTRLSSKVMGGTSTVRSSLICMSSASNT